MKTENEIFTQDQEFSIHSIARSINQYFQKQWDVILQENHDELVDTFEKIGEPAYAFIQTSC